MNTAESNEPAPDILNQPAKPRHDDHVSIIANEIDIALSPIALYADALLEREELDKRSRQYVTSIRRAVDDVAHAVTRLRELDRPRTRNRKARATKNRRRHPPLEAFACCSSMMTLH